MARATARNGGSRRNRRLGTTLGAALCLARRLAPLALLALPGCTKILGDFEVAPAKPPPVEAGPSDIVVSPLKLQTTEWGGRAMFSIVLKVAPTAPVGIALSSKTPTEGTVSPESITFSPQNWNAPQFVYVTGVDDDLVDDNQTYTVDLANATSTDPHYSDMNADDVTVVNVDDETPGITVTPTSGLFTTESGGTATFSVILNAEPEDDVTIDVRSSDPREGSVSPSSLAFSRTNFHSPQTVTVTGVDDFDTDGAKVFQVLLDAAKSNDPGYADKKPSDVEITNIDDDAPGVAISPLQGLITSESGRSATFSVALFTAPSADVVIPFTSTNTKEGLVTPTSLTFNATNWRAPQTITVTGVDDAIRDGNQLYKITTAAPATTDARYRNIDPPDVELTNVDNDSPGVIVTPTAGLATSEDGQTAKFTVALASPPAGDVKIVLTSSRTNEGTISPARLTFTPRNWDAAQTVVVAGVDDTISDGNAEYHVRGTVEIASSDPDYGVVPDFDVSLVNFDNETAGIAVIPTDNLTTTESGGQTAFSVFLRAKPTADVTIAISSKNGNEGTAFPAALTFTAVNYAAPQKVIVTGRDDTIADGDQTYMVVTAPAISADGRYNGLNAADVTITNLDDDTASVAVIKDGALVTTEAGGTATFSVRLNTAPANGVTVSLSSTNPLEGEVSPASVTFTPENWNSPRLITVTGRDDTSADGSILYRIALSTATSADPVYRNLSVNPVEVTNVDNDSAGVAIVADTPLLTTESGGTASFTMALQTQPTTPVTFIVTSSRTGEGTVSPSTVQFNAANWKAPQRVTVTGVEDTAADGSQPYFIIFSGASSTDSAYNALMPARIPAVNIDNDSAGVTVVAARDLVTTEKGGTAQFTVQLNSKPAVDVTIHLGSNKTREGTVSTDVLTFTPLNWSAPQTVTVTGADDNIADGAQPYTIVIDPPMGDPAYAGIDPSDVAIVNLDDDSAGIRVFAPPSPFTTESGDSATFGVALLFPPTSVVKIGVHSSNTNEGSLRAQTLSFTPANWSTPQWATVKGLDDDAVDGDIPYTIVLDPASGMDPAYVGKDPPDIALVNIDNDAPQVLVSAAQGVTTEGGIPTTFSIVLASPPGAGKKVTLPLASNRTTEGSLLVSSVVFTAQNWNAPQTVTVRGVDDNVADGDQIYRIVVGNDDTYTTRKSPDVVITNIDDDSAGIFVTALPGLRTTEAGGTAKFSVTLLNAPTADVRINVVSRDLGEGTVTSPAAGALVFTPANWTIAQTVTVTGVDDTVADSNAPYAIGFQPAESDDLRYRGRTSADVALVNLDDDSAGVSIVATGNLTTTEAGGTATFDIVLNSVPTQGVTISLASTNPKEGLPNHNIVSFSSDDWNVPQTITVTGQQDTIADGNQLYAITFDVQSSDTTGYRDILLDDLWLTNLDDEPPSGARTSSEARSSRAQMSFKRPPAANACYPSK